MATGAQYVDIQQKRLAGFTDFRDEFMDYLRTIIKDNYKRTYDLDGTFSTTKLAIIAGGIDRISLSGAQKGTDAQGNVIDPAQGTVTSLQFENANTIVYYVGCKSVVKPIGLQINALTGNPEFKSRKEIIGELAAPDLVTDNGNGTITFRVNSVTESGVTNAGRSVIVYKKVPGKAATTEGLAIETRTVVFSGGNNSVTTVGNFGQTTVSTTPGDYEVILVGPAIKRNTDLRASSSHWFIGTVTGNTAGNAPVTFSTTDQFLFTATLANISNITRVDSHGFLKVEIKADASDVDEPQLTIKDPGGSVMFSVDEDGDVIFNGYYQGHVRPLTDNTYNLGDGSHRWATVFMNNLNLSGDFIPAVDDSQKIGNATNRWKSALFSTQVTVGGTNAGGIEGSGARLVSYYASTSALAEAQNSYYARWGVVGAVTKINQDVKSTMTAATGTTTTVRGISSIVRNESPTSATITNAMSLYVQGGGSVAANVTTNYYGVYIDSATYANGSSVVNYIGLNIAAIVVGTGTNFAIKTSSGTVEFGDTVQPDADETISLGTAARRWLSICGNGLDLAYDGLLVKWKHLGGAANEKTWFWNASGTTLKLQTDTDVGGTTVDVLKLTRSGTTVTEGAIRTNWRPAVDNTYELGSTSLQWTDFWLKGQINWDGHRASSYKNGNQNTLVTATGGQFRMLDFDTDNESPVGITRTSGVTTGAPSNDGGNPYTKFTFARAGRYQVTYACSFVVASGTPTADSTWALEAVASINVTGGGYGTLQEMSSYKEVKVVRAVGSPVSYGRAIATFTVNVAASDILTIGTVIRQAALTGGETPGIVQSHIEIVESPVD